MTEESEKRDNIRVAFRTKVLIIVGSQRARYQGDSQDISLRGVFLKTGDELELDSVCDVEIELAGTREAIVLCLKGHIVRREEKGYAIYFDSVDLESYTHLKNIVKYNSHV